MLKPSDKDPLWVFIWKPIYFFQYQFVIPDNEGTTGIKNILDEIKNHGQVPALGVLKTFGNMNLEQAKAQVEIKNQEIGGGVTSGKAAGGGTSGSMTLPTPLRSGKNAD